MISQESRLILRFKVRDVIWLTVAVALGFGWWIDRSRLYEEILSQANSAASAKEAMRGQLKTLERHPPD